MIRGGNSSILFNTATACHYPATKNDEAIWCYSGWGPCFTGGGGQGSNLAAKPPFNGTENCVSIPGIRGYEIPELKGVNQLTR